MKTQNQYQTIDIQALELKMSQKRKTEQRRKQKANHKKFKPVKY